MIAIMTYTLKRFMNWGKTWFMMALSVGLLSSLFYFLLKEYEFAQQAQLLTGAQPLDPFNELIYPYFGWLILFNIFFIPFFSMNLIAEEKRTHSIELYLTAFVPPTSVIVGKYSALFLTVFVLNICTLFLPLSLVLLHHLNLELFCVLTCGLLFLIFTFSALSLFMSTLTKTPSFAALMSIIGLSSVTFFTWLTPKSLPLLTPLSLLQKVYHFWHGSLNTQDVLFFLTLIASLLFLSIQRFSWEYV